MILKQTKEVLGIEAKDAGVKGVKIKILLGPSEGAPNFTMRHFRIEPGGHSPQHTHAWEHEVYVLKGAGTVFGGGTEKPLAPGDSVFIPPNEEHQFRAADTEPLEFLCIIPNV